jgi:hypothetical protein
MKGPIQATQHTERRFREGWRARARTAVQGVPGDGPAVSGLIGAVAWLLTGRGVEPEGFRSRGEGCRPPLEREPGPEAWRAVDKLPECVKKICRFAIPWVFPSAAREASQRGIVDD